MPGDSDAQLLFLRDLADVEPPRDRYAFYDDEDIYRLVPRPQWTGLEDEIWTPRSQEHDPQLEKVKALMKRNQTNSAGTETQPTQLSATKFATKLARKKRKNPKVKVRQILNNPFVDAFINICIIWALFSEDIRVLLWPKTMDYAVWWVHLFVMCVFLLELAARSYSQRGFFLSFYFSLDFLASTTMIMDWMPLMQSTTNDVGQSAFRAAKSARVGTRIARLVRVVRIIRVIRLMVANCGGQKKKADEEEAPVEDEAAPSELSKALQGTIAKRTIVFVLVLLLGQVGLEFIPYAGISDPPVDDRLHQGVAQLFAALQNDTVKNITGAPFVPMAHRFRAMMESDIKLESIWETIENPVFRVVVHNYDSDNSTYNFWPVRATDSITAGAVLSDGTRRDDDPMLTWQPTWSNPSSDPRWSTMGISEAPISPDHTWSNCQYTDLGQDNWYNGNGETEMNCPNAMGLNGDPDGATRRMREMRTRSPKEISYEPFPADWAPGDPGMAIEVWYGRKYAEDVQAFFNIMLICCIAILLAGMGYLLSRDVDNLVVRPIESMVDAVTKLAQNPAHKLEKVEKVRYETDALKMSLAKIATMLQVGFGEAGNNLIAENLKKGDTVDPMVPGRKLLGAYGFCIIEEYEDVLEALNEDILPFTNTAASIVHDAVTQNGGQPNRNLGEAFLCVWKPPTRDGIDPSQLSSADLMEAETRMCDGALTAFRRCVRCIAQSAKLQAYNQHEEIIKFFDGNYQTRIGYGLHYGWAIEGAVGTNIKIDCSYLSPNVNLSARLESATRMYGVKILMSESFHSKLSPAVRQGLRRVDVVCLKGSSIPMAIFTCDRSNGLFVSPEAIQKYGEDEVVEVFQKTFELGMDCFVGGDWATSKTHFEAALAICPRDKPSNRIIMHMDTPEAHPDYGLATTPFVAPDGWPGYHILLSK